LNFKEYEPMLKNSIIEAIQSLAFVQLVEAEDKSKKSEIIDKSKQNMLSVYHPIKSEYCIFILTISPAIIKEIADNIFGTDPCTPLDENVENDTISELLNTIAGQFMRSITPPDQYYELGLPVVGSYSLNIEADTLSCTFETENGDYLIVSYVKVNN